MKNENEKEIVIARLIANTRRKKRPNNLIEIANDINWLVSNLGSLKEVSQTLGISSEMLRKFLSVNMLSAELKKFVRERKIDSVTMVHLMSNFDNFSQKKIADEVIAGRLTVDDMKVLVPLKKRLPDLNINQIIARVRKSKNLKIYVLYFKVPIKKNFDAIKNGFFKILESIEIVSFDIKDQIGTLELTSTGLKKLREAAKEQNMPLRKFVDMIVLE